MDPSGRRGAVEPTLEPRGDGTFRCTYRPTVEGPHAVHVAFGGAPIPKSPFNVTVGQGEPRGAPPPPKNGGAGSPPRPGVSVLLSLLLGSLFLELGVSVPPPQIWGSLSPHPPSGGLCLPELGVSVPPPPNLGVSVSPKLGVSVLPSSGGLCASAPPVEKGGFSVLLPQPGPLWGVSAPHVGVPGLSLQGVSLPRDSALSLSVCPAPSARLSGKLRPGSSRVTR